MSDEVKPVPCGDGSTSPARGEKVAPEGDGSAADLGRIHLLADGTLHLFVFWAVDWAEVRARHGRDRLLLRLIRGGDEWAGDMDIGADEDHWRLTAPVPGEAYRVEAGWCDPDGAWRVVARSAEVRTRTLEDEGSAGSEAPRFVRIPFNLSFERIQTLVHLAAFDGEPLAETLSRLQNQCLMEARSPEDASDLGWSPEEREVLESLLGDGSVERFGLSPNEIGRLFSTGLQDAAAGEQAEALSSSERWVRLVELASDDDSVASW